MGAFTNSIGLDLDWIADPIGLDRILIKSNPHSQIIRIEFFFVPQQILTIMNIQRSFIPLIYLIFLDQTDSSSKETTDDNIDLSVLHKCMNIIERNNSLRAGHRQARRERSACWFNNICNRWENVEFKCHFS